jgi:hypothetical protein
MRRREVIAGLGSAAPQRDAGHRVIEAPSRPGSDPSKSITYTTKRGPKLACFDRSAITA